jgi:GTP cyclohydrolase FolE2
MRVGVTNVEKVTRIGRQLYYAKLDCFVELHDMSRFDAVINDVIGGVMLNEGGFKAEQLAQRIAVEVRERLGALRAEVTVAARYPEHKPAPVSGIATQEIYTLLGTAVASERATRRLIGVAAQGMTAQLVAGRSRERLAADGFSDERIAAIFAAVPPATNNQRGLGTLHLGLPAECDTDVDAAELLAIVEDSMSSEIYELMKRSDEARRRLRARGDPEHDRALRPLGRRRVRVGAPGEPRIDPPAQRGRRALRADRRAAPLGPRASHDDAGVAQRSLIRSAPWSLRWSSAVPLASRTPRRSTSAA